MYSEQNTASVLLLWQTKFKYKSLWVDIKSKAKCRFKSDCKNNVLNVNVMNAKTNDQHNVSSSKGIP